LFKDMCFLDFCKMKMSIREATLNLQKPCMSARIAPWLAVSRSAPHTVKVSRLFEFDMQFLPLICF
jgi:hypothetical protein